MWKWIVHIYQGKILDIITQEKQHCGPTSMIIYILGRILYHWTSHVMNPILCEVFSFSLWVQGVP